jgi:two-component system sensor histidine kinase DesK
MSKSRVPERPQCPPFDPTGMMPGVLAASASDRWRRRIAINVSLLWLLFPVLDLAGAHPTPIHAVLVALPVIAFVAIYARLPRARSPGMTEVGASLAALTLIATGLTLADRTIWAELFIFAAIFGAVRLDRRGGSVWILWCAALTAATTAAGTSDVGSTVSLTASTLAVGFMMMAFRQLIDLNAELAGAREEVARLAVSEERLRFARDLHDLLGQSLTVIAVKAELAERLLRRDAPGAVGHVTDIKTVARDALTGVRDAVSGYRQPNLASELSGAAMALQAAGISARLEGDGLPRMDPDVEAVLAWAVREGTTNVIRHSGARNCQIAVAPGPPAATAEVIDDGQVTELDGAGSGLAGLRERAERLAGRLEVGPVPGGGFRLWVTIPLPVRVP